ncbi:hypothetical protein H5410_049631 [Solanum commersonii]|uniref:Uncharacterized protein n=1 Tax=Solanum commersonii TaxID=4109 RepID=A0A9J5WV83_SOLCO|nr:hypothetical protein H5410_049631 [Solanum commersonii]
MRKRVIFAEFLGPHTAIGSLGLHICNWFDTGQAFGACFDKVNSGVYSVNRVLLFGCSNGFPLLSVDDTSDVCEVSSLTTAHKVFVDMLDRSYTHIEYPCISANHAVGVVSSGALEKYIDAYDFIQYFYFCNFNLSRQPYTTVASSHGDNSFTVLGLLEQLNTIGEVPVDLWYKFDVAINQIAGVLRSGNWPWLILFSADQVLHVFVTNQCARTVFGRLWSCSNDLNQRAGVSFVCDVLNDNPQSSSLGGFVTSLE